MSKHYASAGAAAWWVGKVPAAAGKSYMVFGERAKGGVLKGSGRFDPKWSNCVVLERWNLEGDFQTVEDLGMKKAVPQWGNGFFADDA